MLKGRVKELEEEQEEAEEEEEPQPTLDLKEHQQRNKQTNRHDKTI